MQAIDTAEILITRPQTTRRHMRKIQQSLYERLQEPQILYF
jgi:hypothetical protein